MQLIVHTDGGARGNPGPAAIGVVIEKIDPSTGSGRAIAAFGKTIGETTNNVAEYTAVIEALMWFKTNLRSTTSNQQLTIQCFLDSTLVVNQLNGLFKVKEPHLRELLMQIRTLEQELGGTITYAAVRRQQNARADFLVNDALDRREP